MHQALLTGLLSGIAYRSDTYQYTGPGGNKFHLWPGSALFEKRPKWIVAAELVETSRRFCRVVARINPDWIEPLAAHLVSRSYHEPHWDRRSGSPMVYERVTLFGLLIVPRRRVPLGPVDPDTARQLFIEHALVQGELPGKFAFLDHNRAILKEIEALAAKERRSDWIVGQHAVYQYYDRHLPSHVYELRRLKDWLKREAAGEHAPLFMRREDFLPDSVEDGSARQFPDHMALTQAHFPLTYRFVPGDPQDGITMTVPRHAINQVSSERIDWLVPGRLEEKITALIRSLPKSIRRCLVPAPDTARRAAEQLPFGTGPFLQTLARTLEQISGESVPADAFQLDRLPPHLVMKVRVVDDDGTTLAVDHSLQRLRETFGPQAQGASPVIDDSAWHRPPTTDWDFGELPPEIHVQRGGVVVSAYPAVLDQQDHVVVRLLDTLDRAEQESRAGIRRLYYLAEKKALQAHVAWLPKLSETRLLASTLVSPRDLDTQLALLIADRAFLGRAPLPRSEAEYRERLKDAAERAGLAVQQVTSLMHPLFESYHRAQLALEDLSAKHCPAATHDVQQQLNMLLEPEFLISVDWMWLEHFPRYLAAIVYRLDKLTHGGYARDTEGLEQLQPWLQQYQQRAESHRQRGAVDPHLTLFRWMLEEFRVSLFAQPLGTSLTVSAKRLEKQWAKVAP